MAGMSPLDVQPAAVKSTGVQAALLGRALGTPQPSWETSLDRQIYPWLDHHRFRGRMVFPGMGYLDLGHAAGKTLHPEAALALHEVKFSRACLISENQPPTLQTIIQAESGEFTVHGRRSAKAGWTLHARGFVRPRPQATTEPVKLTDIWDRCPIDIARDDCYRLFRERGLDYGATFQGIDQMWRGEAECLARIAVPAQLGAANGWLHPATVDACLHVLLGAVLPSDGQPDAVGNIYLPVEVAEVHVQPPTGETLWSHGRLAEHSADAVSADVCVFEETGRVVWEARGLRCQAVASGAPDK
jgi:acyl transferase domain-containing protein